MHILLVTSDFIREEVCGNGNTINGVPILVWHVHLFFDFIRLVMKFQKKSTILTHKRMVETIKYKIQQFKRDHRYLLSAGGDVGYRTIRLLDIIDADLHV